MFARVFWVMADRFWVQYVPVGGAAVGFLLAWGIKWNRIEGAEKSKDDVVGEPVTDDKGSGSV